ncbi:hypothetical protein JCM15548_13394 [Geofilum rubicundum JCM 15548]|uniref:DUF4249 domain-containing protein n=2 Tax=Geofilum TaxID=1236988 RepID=A0A0E9M0I8_9BACT|nr:hypothetical protein JCM15548_13394 [Geofilum rubicundum JCM 15548]
MNHTKYNPLTLIIASLVLLGLGSCESMVDDFEYEKKSSKLVVNAILSPDSVINIHISSSTTYNPPGALKLIENAVVELYENNNLLGQLRSTGNGYYILHGTYPQENATYKVVVTADGYASAWAETTIPGQIKNPEVEEGLQTTTYEYGYTATRMAYQLTYDVPQSQAVFYSVSISSQKQGTLQEYVCEELETPWFDGYYYRMDSCYLIEGDSLATRTEPISIYSNSSLIKFRKSWGDYQTSSFDDEISAEKLYFSSQNYNSSQLSLALRIDYYYLFDNIDNEITIWTDSFDEVLFKFMYSLAQKREVEDDPFAEKVSVYTNVNGGLGIFGSSNSRALVIRYDDEFIERLSTDN